MNRLDDKQLMALSQEGDSEAFATLFDRYYNILHGTLTKYCGNSHDAEDILQDAFVKVAKKVGSYRGEASVKNWIFKIALNQAHDWHRKRVRIDRKHQDFGEQVNTVYHSRRENDDLQLALMKLSDKERQAVLLVYFEDMSHAEAGQILGCSESTVSWRIHVAKKKLRDALETSSPCLLS